MSRIAEALFTAAYVSGIVDRAALTTPNGADVRRINSFLTASRGPEHKVSPRTARPHEAVVLFTDAHSRTTPGRPSGSGVGRVRHQARERFPRGPFRRSRKWA